MTELERIERLKVALKHATEGQGIAAALLETFRRSGEKPERETARQTLLGVPIKDSISATTGADGGAGVELLRYLVFESSVNSIEAGRKAEKLASYFERLTQMRNRRVLEQKALGLRSRMIAGILGAVLAMISGLAPVLASFQFLGAQHAPSTAYIPYFGFGSSLVSSYFLASFSSSKRKYVEPLITAATYALTFTLVSPLVAFGPPAFVGG